MLPPGRVLGLDYGERRLGVAVSDPERRMASGLATLDRRKHPDILASLGEILARERATAIVLGHPLRTDGERHPGDKAEAVEAFAEALKARFGLPVHLEDESFSSARAAESLRRRRGRGVRGGKPRNFAREKADIDRVAACYILQDWLDRNAP